jgi:ABC-type Fe3+ transport system permease subunit
LLVASETLAASGTVIFDGVGALTVTAQILDASANFDAPGVAALIAAAQILSASATFVGPVTIQVHAEGIILIEQPAVNGSSQVNISMQQAQQRLGGQQDGV